MADKPLCKIESCGKSGALRRGMCQSHYDRWRRSGDPLPKIARAENGAPFQWLEGHLDFIGSECILWPFARHPNGYGAIRHKGLSTFPHRVMCRLTHGEPDDEKMEAAHSCGEKLCCNPRHLRWATHCENEADKVDHGTTIRGERQWKSRLTADDVRSIRLLFSTKSDIQIANKFGVSPNSIYAIRTGYSWAWLD